jgi:hypothetical protein
LIYDESHHQGHPALATDLRYWGDILPALERYHAEGNALTKIDISGNKEANDAVISTILTFSQSLTSLNINSCSNITTSGILNVCSLPRLTSLNIGNLSTLTDSDVCHLVNGLINLEEINLSKCSNLTDVSLRAIALAPFRNLLHVFSCSHNSNVTHVGINKVIFECSQLLSVDISHCSAITHIGIVISADTTYGFNEKPMKQYATRNLTHLNATACPLRVESLDWIGSALPGLESLHVSGVSKVSNGFIQAVSLGCPNLKFIDVKACRQIDSTAVLLVAGCRCRSNLLHLDLSFLGSKKLHSIAIKHILDSCTSLESLDITGNPNLTDEMFVADKGPRVDGQGHLLRSSLRKLHMQGCTLVTSSGIRQLASIHFGLEEININGLVKVDNDSLVALGSLCRDLRVLKANDCLGLSGDGLEHLVMHCRDLIELHIGTVTSNTDAWGGRVVQYSDKTLRAILHFSRKLRVLDIRNQCGITMSSAWLNGGRSEPGDFSGHVCLRKIDMLGADKLSPAGMIAVLSKCFALEEVIFPAGAAATGVSEALENEEIARNKAEEAALAAFKTKRVGGKKGLFKAMAASASRMAKKDVDGGSVSSVSTASEEMDLKVPSMSSGGPTIASGDSPRARWLSMFRYCRYSTNSGLVDGKERVFWGGLYPHRNREIWYYRDAYIRRQMDEQWAARKIQGGYRLMIRYRHVMSGNTAKYLQRWYRCRVRDHKLSLIRDRLYIIEMAKRIQKNFKRNLLPLLRSIVLVQRIVRGWRGRTSFALYIKKNAMAKQIQKMVRGMLVRLSDRYILAQIYIKLPPFWKTVIHSCAPDEGDNGVLASLGSFTSHGEYNERVKMYQISKKKKEVQDMIKGIEGNRTTLPSVEYASSGAERTFDLAPKLPFIVPQAFDKNPYVSRADGRKLAYFGDRSSLFRSESTEKGAAQSLYASKAALTFGLDNIAKDYEEKRVHQYTFSFWPMQPSKSDAGADTSLFDPMLNGFEVRQNMKHTLHCELCGLRLRLIFCKHCVKGFCFFCAFKAHVDGSKRGHHMDMIEPRVVQVKESSKSLVYHMDMVEKTTYDIK